MAITKVTSEVLDLTDAYAFTGAVTGAGGGLVLQVIKSQTGAVSSGTTTMPRDDTIPQNTEGVALAALDTAITPTDTAHILRIDVTINFANSALGPFTVALFQDSTASALFAAPRYHTDTDVSNNLHFQHYMTAGTTSATTFKIRAGMLNAGTTYFNGRSAGRDYGGVAFSSMMVTEINV